MNKTEVLKLANDIFDTVNPFKNDTYKAELFLGGKKPAGIYFIDFNPQLNTEKFEEYQEQLLAEEYFNSKGYIQWNYYLLLLQDKFDLRNKQIIEENEKYARKYVFTESDFRDFFAIEKSKHEIDEDIIINWCRSSA